MKNFSIIHNSIFMVLHVVYDLYSSMVGISVRTYTSKCMSSTLICELLVSDGLAVHTSQCALNIFYSFRL